MLVTKPSFCNGFERRWQLISAHRFDLNIKQGAANAAPCFVFLEILRDCGQILVQLLVHCGKQFMSMPRDGERAAVSSQQ